MRKEDLELKKRKTVMESKASNRAKQILLKNLSRFSVEQLKIACNMMDSLETQIASESPFYTLSADEVMQKSTGRIAYFDGANVREETEKEILTSAACTIYTTFKQFSSIV